MNKIEKALLDKLKEHKNCSRKNCQINVFKKRYYIGPENIKITNYLRTRPIAIFNPGAVLNGKKFHIFPRLIFDYYKYTSSSPEGHSMSPTSILVKIHIKTEILAFVVSYLMTHIYFIRSEPPAHLLEFSRFNFGIFVKLGKGKYLSFYVDFYQYTGGAHGMTFRTAYTFDLSRGRITNLSELFACRYDFKEAIVKEINRQLKEILKTEPQKFFISEIKDLFGTGFYLENDNLVIYYGLYEIAPYVEGIVEFSVPFELFGDKLLISTTEE